MIRKAGKSSPPVSRRFWTPHERAVMMRLYGRIKTADIAARLQRTPGSVRNQGFILGRTRKRPRVDAGKRAIIAWMARAGACNPCIAVVVGSDRHRVAHWRRRLDLPRITRRGFVKTCGSCMAWVRRQTRAQCRRAGDAGPPGEVKAALGAHGGRWSLKTDRE